MRPFTFGYRLACATVILLFILLGNGNAQVQSIDIPMIEMDKSIKVEFLQEHLAKNEFEDNIYMLVRLKKKQDISACAKIIQKYDADHYLISFPKENASDIKTQIDAYSLTYQNLKIAKRLREKKQNLTDRETLVISILKSLETDCVIKELETNDATVLESLSYNHFKIEIDQKHVNTLAKLPFVLSIDLFEEEFEPLNYESNLASNASYTKHAFTESLTGEGVVIGIGDGGMLGEHLDKKDRIPFTTSTYYSSWGSHPDHVSGTMMGAGNKDPRHEGIAPSADLVTEVTTRILSYFPNHYTDYDMKITNNSYGSSTNCSNAGAYDYYSALIDNQMNQFYDGLHVAAAGNMGSATCGAFPQGYGTILRGLAASKNGISVGAVQPNKEIWVNSSRGPVADGRIKPDLVAVGAGVTSTSRNGGYYTGSGTSHSSPAVAGAAALLYEFYKKENNNNPSAALIKSVLMNTAQDLGNYGPDFIYGFGLIDVKRAVNVLKNNQFTIDTMTHNNQTKTYSITIPSGLHELKVMNYWHDKAAEYYAPQTLMHNLDMEVIAPDGTIFKPWILDPVGSGVSSPATRGDDNVNNVEQVTLLNPQAGVYTIKIKAGMLLQGSDQGFVVNYDFVEEGITLNFPIGNEKIKTGESVLVQWESSSNTTNNLMLEYSVDSGISWLLIDNNIPFDAKSYAWTTPSTTQTKVKLRISNGIDSDISQADFQVFDAPSNLQASSDCYAGVELTWTPHAEAHAYVIYQLINGKMQRIDTTSNTSSYVIQGLDFNANFWFAVSAMDTNGKEGIRSNAVEGSTSISGTCAWSNDLVLAGISLPTPARDQTNSSLTNQEAISVNIHNKGNNDRMNFKVSYRFQGEVIEEFVNTTIQAGDSLSYTFQTKADMSAIDYYEVDAWISGPNETINSKDSLIGIYATYQLPNHPKALGEEFTFDALDEFNDYPFLESSIGLPDLDEADFTGGTSAMIKVVNLDYQNKYLEVFNQNAIDTSTLRFTYNLEILEGLSLAFQYRYQLSSTNGGQVRVEVRGSDADPWINAQTIGDGIIPQSANPTEGLQVLQITDWTQSSPIFLNSLLGSSGQSVSSSTQLRFIVPEGSNFAIDSLSVADASTLPVELLSFEAKKKDKTTTALSWITASEQDNDYFEIQAAFGDENLAAANFKTLARVEGQGTTSSLSHYYYEDQDSPKTGRIYYRLKQVDYGATDTEGFSFSEIRLVDYTSDASTLLVYPNPIADHTVYIKSDTDFSASSYTLYNTLGTKITEGQLSNNQIELPTHINQGNYLLVITNNDRVFTQTIIVNTNNY